MQIKGDGKSIRIVGSSEREAEVTMFRYRRQVHRWACRVLLLWFVGTVTCVTNASLAASLTGLGGQRSEPAVAAEAHHGKTASEGSDVRHGSPQMQHEAASGPDGPPVNENCSGDHCGKFSVSILPLKSALDASHGYALPPAAVALACPVPESSPGQRLLPRRDGGLAPAPITIAFLRLAL